MVPHIDYNEITLATPALLFSAISLIMLAYTNRFVVYTQVIRNLKDRYDQNRSENIAAQIETLHKRLLLMRRMQRMGIGSLFLCVLSMFVIYIGMLHLAAYIFAIALILLVLSLAYSVWEIQISSKSIELLLQDMEK
jgi:hypothetical protein